MNKNIVINYLMICLTTGMLVFGFEIYTQDVSLTAKNALVYGFSAVLGTVLAGLYFSLVGHKFYKHQFLATLFPCVLFALIATKLGSAITMPIHELTIIVSSLLIISSSFEKRKN